MAPQRGQRPALSDALAPQERHRSTPVASVWTVRRLSCSKAASKRRRAPTSSRPRPPPASVPSKVTPTTSKPNQMTSITRLPGGSAPRGPPTRPRPTRHPRGPPTRPERAGHGADELDVVQPGIDVARIQAQTVRELLRDPRAVIGRELRLARDELTYQALCLTWEAADLDLRAGAQRRHRSEREVVEPRPRRADHERACREIAETLRARRDHDREQPEAVETREEVDDADEIAHEDGGEPRGRAVVGDDAKSEHALPDRLSVAEPFEEDEVAPRHGEREEQRDPEVWRRRLETDRIREQAEHEERADEDERGEDEVDQRGEPAIPAAGEVVAKDDVIGGLDFEPPERDGHRHMVRSRHDDRPLRRDDRPLRRGTARALGTPRAARH